MFSFTNMFHLFFSLLFTGATGKAYIVRPFPLPAHFNISHLRSASVQSADTVQNVQKQPEVQAPQLLLDDDLQLSPMDDRDTSSCGGTLTNLQIGTKGTISSPNYPNNYPADVKCVWWLKAEQSATVSITCSYVYTQSCDQGYYDYILIAPDWAWVKYYLLCGDYNKFTPFTISSTENFMSVYFRTSLQQNYKGFTCSYEVVKNVTTVAAPVTTTTTTTVKPVTVEYNGEAGCGIPNASNRIVGGTGVQPHRYPWMVGLSFNGQWFCGGTLLNKEWILTAAHCTHGAISAYAYLGAHNLYNEEEGRLIIFSQEFVEHPQYNVEKISNDVALVHLPKNSIPAYTKNISPGCLPARNAVDLDMAGQSLFAVGWGKTQNGALISPTLNELRVSLVTNDVCKKSYGDIIQPSNVCAQGANGTGTCQGDSGSSLQYSPRDGLYIQYGIVSFGASTGCGSGYPNGYTRVTSYLDFISATVGINFN